MRSEGKDFELWIQTDQSSNPRSTTHQLNGLAQKLLSPTCIFTYLSTTKVHLKMHVIKGNNKCLYAQQASLRNTTEQYSPSFHTPSLPSGNSKPLLITPFLPSIISHLYMHLYIYLYSVLNFKVMLRACLLHLIPFIPHYVQDQFTFMITTI